MEELVVTIVVFGAAIVGARIVLVALCAVIAEVFKALVTLIGTVGTVWLVLWLFLVAAG